MTAILGAAIIVLMYGLDAREIGWMPKRGTASLWPIRILTNFGKSAYVLWALAGLLIVVSFVSPAVRGPSRGAAARVSARACSSSFWPCWYRCWSAEVHQMDRGRGRPFVGGEANAFNFSHFAGGEAYASFPSGHAVTAAALAFAVSAVWPQLRSAMIVYAILIALSRLVLLAHHPSDVVAGTLVGVVGAMAVRYWFAARRLGFNDPQRRRHCGAAGALVAAPQGGCPRAVCPIRSGRREAPDAAVPARANSSDEYRFAFLRPNNSGRFDRCARAQRSRQCGAADRGDRRRARRPVELTKSSTSTTAPPMRPATGSPALMKLRGNLRQLRHAASSGQSAAVRSGVRVARGTIVATLDGDGQNDPAFLPELIAAVENGGDRVGLAAGQRVGRKDTGFKKLQSRIANGVRNAILHDGTRDTGCGLKAFRREVFLVMPYFDGLHRFLPALVRREGFDIAYVDVIDRPRHSGVSNYGFFDRLWIGIMDLAGVWWLIRRKKPTPVATEVTSHD